MHAALKARAENAAVRPAAEAVKAASETVKAAQAKSQPQTAQTAPAERTETQAAAQPKNHTAAKKK